MMMMVKVMMRTMMKLVVKERVEMAEPKLTENTSLMHKTFVHKTIETVVN